jgi:chromosome segregation ATPase
MGAEHSYEFDCRGDSWIALGGRDEVNRFRGEWERLNSLEREKAREILRIQQRYEDSRKELEKAGYSYRQQLEQLKRDHEQAMHAKVTELKNYYEKRLKEEQEKNAKQAKEHEAVVSSLKQMHVSDIKNAVQKETNQLKSKLVEVESRFDKTDQTLQLILSKLGAGNEGKAGKEGSSTRRGSTNSSFGSDFGG